jgi:hypothetical protein
MHDAQFVIRLRSPAATRTRRPTIRTDSDVYTRMIREAGRGRLHRYYVIEGASHVDSC